MGSRYKRRDTCGECGACNGTICTPAKEDKLRSYQGIRVTADLFDCALPVAMDSHSVCSFNCCYCFSENLFGHVGAKKLNIGQTRLSSVESLFSGLTESEKILKYRRILDTKKSPGGYPCPIQIGAINDPGDNIERQQGWLLDVIKLAIKYRQPLRLSTKGTVLRQKDYLNAMAQAPELFWVAFSIISPDDDVLSKIDIGAPNATERLKTMAALSKIGVKTSLRFRPMFPGISDKTPRYPKAYKALIDKAAEAGAVAVSYECGFYPGRLTADAAKRWDILAKVSGAPLPNIYRSFGGQACTRPSYTWTENIMHAVAEVAHSHGMVVGVSDPVWKQLTDTGCCCGILPGDEVFGGWSKQNATNSLLIAKNKKRQRLITFADSIPAWTEEILLAESCYMGAGPKTVYKKRHLTLFEKYRSVWNDPKSQRGPAVYFQGAVEPTSTVDEDGNIVYKYVGLERQHMKAPYWSV